MPIFNPFFNFTIEQCDAEIAEIQERLLVGAAKVAHAGSGGMYLVAQEADIANLQHSANRRADIMGERRPGRAVIRAFVEKVFAANGRFRAPAE